jgi:tetratricopeptide (TPR) repeat protein
VQLIWRITSAGLTVLAFAAIALAQDRDSEARRHFQAAQRAQQAESYSVAAQEYRKVIALMPKAAEAYASLGLVYNAQNNFAESAQVLEKAEKLKPGLPGVALYLGIDLVKLNQPDVAIRRLREALRLEPANKQAWLWLSTALSEAGQGVEARQELAKARSLFPTDPVILLRLGEAYRRAADAEIEHVMMSASGQPLVHQVYGDIYKDERLWQKANGHYRRVIAEDAHWPGAHLSMAEVALRQGLLDEAEKEFHLELDADPNSAGADAGLAEIALLRGKTDEALALLKAGIRVAPVQASFALGLPPSPAIAETEVDVGALDCLRNSLPILQSAPQTASRSLALAFVNWRLGDANAFHASWKEFESVVPHFNTNSALENGINDFYLQKLDVASTELNAWIKSNPNDLRAAYFLARTYRDLSLSLLKQLLVLAPDSYPAHQFLAETYANVEDDEKAIAEYKSVELLAPDLPGIHFAIGHLILRHGSPEEAMVEFQAEMLLNPNHAGANAEIGAILVQKEEQQEGVIYLKKAIQLEPGLWAAHRELGEAYYRQKNYALAEAELQKAINHDPEGLAYYQLGLVYRALGRLDAAKKMLGRAREIKADRLSMGIEAEAQAAPEASHK